MASIVATFVRPRVFAALAVLLAIGTSVGCGTSDTKIPPANLPGADASASSTATDARGVPANVDPAKLLAEMVATYRQAKSYQDAGELHIDVDTGGGRMEKSPIIPFSVAFERPNKIRIHSLNASIVADGRKLYGSVTSLSRQVLVTPDPQTLTLESLEADKLLVQAMRGEIDIKMPQLDLLLTDDPILAIAGDGAPTLLPDEELAGEPCHRVAIEGQAGTSVFWISPKTLLLLKLEFPSDAFAKEHSLAGAAITVDLKGAEVDGDIVADAFAFDVPDDAKLLKRFLPLPPDPPSPLLGKKPGEFQFVDASGEVVNQETLAGRVVVLDMWATWCGWCFEGFPNLQQVYDQFQDDDKVAILAVNTDDVSVSDEQVRKSFEEAKLTIPIVRDTKRAADQVFQVRGLPTMVILGPDGTIEEYHVGYDPKLAETLPKKLERLLSGESLAAEELEKYEKAVERYEQEEAEALVADAGGSGE